MKLRVIYVFTHDSIGSGEDGPTHQPIGQIPHLRAMPNLTLIRPADASETVEAWRVALTNTNGPTALVLTRQNLPSLDRTKLASANGARKGGYILSEAGNGKPDIIIIATGSEVFRSVYAQEKLLEYNVNARVVSMPSWELFDLQSDDYRNEVLPPEIRKRISVEAAATFGWEHYVGLDGVSIGMTTFGASAPGEVALEKFGFTTENIVKKCLEIAGRK